ncbi:hypothetical protein PSPO01_03294 [Paraphaeosphaeria sporulosa]
MGTLGRNAKFAIDMYNKVTSANLPLSFYILVDKRVYRELADALMYVKDDKRLLEVARLEGPDLIGAVRALRELWVTSKLRVTDAENL